MNNKEASINKVDELVNRAQLAINDWQCSGDGDYVLCNQLYRFQGGV